MSFCFKTILKVITITIILSLLSGCTFVLTPQKGPVEEILIKPSERFTMNKVLMIDISGELTSKTSESLLYTQENSVDCLKEILDYARNDRFIKGIILRIDSPGGEVTAADLMYREIENFKKETNIKVCSMFMGTAASGGYYLAMASDKIFAIPTCITGSIGVIAVLPNFRKLTDKIGVEIRTIKSGNMKDIGSIWRDFTNDERTVLQGLIDGFYGQFTDIILKNRKALTPEKLKVLADGRVYNAEDALKEKLIDQIAYPDEVFKEVKNEFGIKDYNLVTYGRSYDYKASYYSKGRKIPAESTRTEINLLKINDASSMINLNPKFYYIWMP